MSGFRGTVKPLLRARLELDAARERHKVWITAKGQGGKRQGGGREEDIKKEMSKWGDIRHMKD